MKWASRDDDGRLVVGGLPAVEACVKDGMSAF